LLIELQTKSLSGGFLKLADNVRRYISVADYEALNYQITQNYNRVVTLQISTNTAINYTTGYSQLIF
jgi:hypothetical protein